MPGINEFPLNPTNGQIYTNDDGFSWKWNNNSIVKAWEKIVLNVKTLNGLSGGVTLAAGTGITFSISGNTLTISATSITGPTGATGSQGPIGNTGPTGATPTDYVVSFNGLTGAVTGVTTSVANTFTALQTFNSGITSSGITTGVLLVNGNGTITSNLTVNGDANLTTIRNASIVLYLQNTGDAVAIGDGLGEGNGTYFTINDSTTSAELATSSFLATAFSEFSSPDLTVGPALKVNSDSSTPGAGPVFTISDTNQMQPNRVTVGASGTMTLLNQLQAIGGISAGASIFSGGITAPNIVNSINGITGPAVLVAGTGITLTTSGKNLTITNTQAAGSVDKAFVIAMSIAL